MKYNVATKKCYSFTVHSFVFNVRPKTFHTAVFIYDVFRWSYDVFDALPVNSSKFSLDDNLISLSCHVTV